MNLAQNEPPSDAYWSGRCDAEDFFSHVNE